MKKTVTSKDAVSIHYESTGKGSQALVLVHGWLGNSRWWDLQRDAFASDYCVVQIDLAGHGRSGSTRKVWSVAAYADDIQAVVDDLPVESCILVGHSMSGSNVLEAALRLGKRVCGVVLVDTLHDLDHMATQADVAPMMEGLRHNYAGTVEMALANFLLLPSSPANVRERLRQEFLSVSPDLAIAALAPFYETDIRPTASQLKVPVRAVNSEMLPTQAVNNRRYLKNFDHVTMSEVGHYPMLEDAVRFNQLLSQILATIPRN